VLEGGSSPRGPFLVMLATLLLSCFPSIPLPSHMRELFFLLISLEWRNSKVENGLSLLQYQPNPEGQGIEGFCCCLNWGWEEGKGSNKCHKSSRNLEFQSILPSDTSGVSLIFSSVFSGIISSFCLLPGLLQLKKKALLNSESGLAEPFFNPFPQLY